MGSCRGPSQWACWSQGLLLLRTVPTLARWPLALPWPHRWCLVVGFPVEFTIRCFKQATLLGNEVKGSSEVRSHVGARRLPGWSLPLALALVGPYTPAWGLSFPSCKSRPDHGSLGVCESTDRLYGDTSGHLLLIRGIIAFMGLSWGFMTQAG